MNLRGRSVAAYSRLTLDAFSISFRLDPRRQADMEAPISTASCIVLSAWNCISNSLPGHQLERSLGPIDLWKQVQKVHKSVDFTSVGAPIENG